VSSVSSASSALFRMTAGRTGQCSVHVAILAGLALIYSMVGLKSDGTMGYLEVDTPRATVPSLSMCDRHTTGHWPMALFKRRDR